MRLIIVVVLLGLSAQALWASPTESETEPSGNQIDESVTPSGSQVCVPNEVKMEDCNRCKCAPNGVGWFCTRKACPVLLTDATVPTSSHHKRECEPGTTFKRDCNSCRCSPSGLAICTKMMCVTPPVPDEVKPETHVSKRSADEKQCEPGTNWKEDCNTCFCTPTGAKACTLMRCFSLEDLQDLKALSKEAVEQHKLSKRSSPDIFADSYHCEPNKPFVHPDGCNNCECNEHGKTKFCTQRECPKKEECVPGTTFKMDCNTCHCDSTGKATCTKMGCSTFREKVKIDTQVSKRSLPDVFADSYHCEPNKPFVHPDGCNHCECDEHGKTRLCTQMECPKKEECVPGTTFKMDCNTCHCDSTGKATCTKMGCSTVLEVVKIDTQDSKESADEKKCEPGTKWKEDCNRCFCSKSGFKVCTLAECDSSEDLQDLKALSKEAIEQHKLSKRSLPNVFADSYHCEPNKQFIHPDGCNDCECDEHGKTKLCTRKNCPVRPKGEECVPGTKFKKDCNECHCSSTGLATCTKMMCIKLPARSEAKLETHVSKRSTDEKECEPGTSWKNDCNTCHCTSTGFALCTQMGCITVLEKVKIDPKKEECVPGTTFQRDCNTCHCDSNGLATCTKMSCNTVHEAVIIDTQVSEQLLPDVFADSYHCEPNKRFIHPDGCNDCMCDKHGKTNSCTRMECPVRPKRDVVEKECEAGNRWKEDCNDCFCTETGLKVCTKKRCPSKHKRSLPDVYADSYHCEPNKQFTHPDGCNKCQCNEHGKTKYCTKLHCQNRPKRSPISSKGKCTPGQGVLADDGCNTCICQPDGTIGACTEMLCLKKPRNVRSLFTANHNDPGAPNFSCTPGSSFKHVDGCNQCKCAENGKIAACTLKLCVERPRTDPFAPNFHCTPGSTFVSPADGCNTCTCKDDGTTAYCTQMACFEEHHKTKRSPNTNDPGAPDFSCVPGMSFKHADGCNDCTCSTNGKFAACTLKLCPAAATQSLVEEPRAVRAITNNNDPNAPNFRCSAGDQFNHVDGCNFCICNADGRSAACTLRVCLSTASDTADITPGNTAIVSSPQEKKCVPGSRFMSEDGCNTCFCTKEGKVGCTLMYCGNKPVEPLPGGTTPIKFPINQRTKRDTELANLPNFNTSVEGFKCEPGLRFRDDCNLCRCNNDGKAACTDKLCPSGD